MHLHFHLHDSPLPNITPCRRSGLALHDAVIGGHLDIVRLLVEAGADVNQNVSAHSSILFHNLHSLTPLEIAIRFQVSHVEEFLRSVGGRANRENGA